MAITITAKPNQSMQDLVLMACGTMDGAMDFCLANGVRISDVPVVGNEYVVPAAIAQDEVVLTELQQKGIVIGTLNPDPTPVTGPYSIILYPMMEATIEFPGITGGYELKLSDTGSLIHSNPLPTLWPLANHLLSEHKDDYMLDGGGSAVDVTPMATLQSDRETRYFLAAGVSPVVVYMWWSDYSDPYNPTLTYEDVAGWRATFSPLVLYSPTYFIPRINTLIGTMDISVDSVVGPTTNLRIDIGHTLINIPDFNLIAQGVAYRPAAGGIWTVVAGTSTVGGHVNLALTAGVYELLLKCGYQSDDASVFWPTSFLTMIIEVY